MNEQFENHPTGPLVPEASKTGCRKFGCGGCLVILLAFWAAAAVVVYIGYKSFLPYTALEPVDAPIYDAMEDETEQAREKLDRIRAALENETADTVIFTDTDLNALVARDTEFATAKGRVFFKLEEYDMLLDFSVPLDEFPGFSGRWLNGKTRLKLFMQNDRIVVQTVELHLNGEDVPPELMDQIKDENLASSAARDPAWREIEKHLKTVAIEDTHLKIQTR